MYFQFNAVTENNFILHLNAGFPLITIVKC